MKTLQVPKIKMIERYWFDYNPSLTHFMSALSVLFPDGERFFMKSMNAYRKKLPDYFINELNEFCVQEANHGRLHSEMNSMIDDGILLKLEERTKIALDLVGKIFSDRQKLAITICLEHLTAIMGKHLLLRDDLTSQMSGDAKTCWLYHAEEEVEHAHVAYDIYNYIHGGYLTRSIFMIPVTVGLAYIIIHNWTDIMNHDQRLGDDGLFSTLITLIGRDGFITNMIPEYLEWFKPSFHPSKN